MDPRLQRRVQRYGWDKAAAQYERFWARQLEPAQTRMFDLAALGAGEQVLDVACGTGLITFRAQRAVGPGGRVMAIDISDEMVQAVCQAALEQGASNVTTERMDAEELRLPDASFDATLCALGLMYCPEPGNALREMLRVLKPGGRLAVAVWGARPRCGWAEIFPIVERRVSSDVCPLFFQLGTGDALSYAMEQAGFVGIVSERLATTLHYETGEDACGAAFAGGPVAMAYSRFDDATREAAYAEYLASIEPFRDGAGYAVPGEFVVARARKAVP